MNEILRWGLYATFVFLVYCCALNRVGRQLIKAAWSILGMFLSMSALLVVCGLVELPFAIAYSNSSEVSITGARLAGVMEYPNAFGAVMAVFLLERLFAVSAFYERPSPARDRGAMREPGSDRSVAEHVKGDRTTTALLRVLPLLPLFPYAAALLLSESRGAWLTTACACAAVLLWKRQLIAPLLAAGAAPVAAAALLYRQLARTGLAVEPLPGLLLLAGLWAGASLAGLWLCHRQRSAAGSARAAMLALAAAGWTAAGTAVLLLVRERITGPSSTVSARGLFYRDAWRLAAEAPWLGRGGETWRSSYLAAQSRPYVGSQVHSGYLDILLNLGFVGLAAILFMLLAVGWLLAKRSPRLLPPFLVIILHSAVDFDWSYGLIWLLLFWLPALAMSEHEQKHQSATTRFTSMSSLTTHSTSVNSQPTHSTSVSSQPTHSTSVNSQPTHSTSMSSQPTHSTSVKSQPTHSTSVSSLTTHSTSVKSQPTHSTSMNSLTTHSACEKSQPTHSTSMSSLTTHSTSENSQPTHSTSENSLTTHSTSMSSLTTHSTSENSQPTHSTSMSSLTTHSTSVNSLTTHSTSENSLTTHSTSENSLTTHSTSENSQPTHSTSVSSLTTHSTSVNSLTTHSTSVNSLNPAHPYLRRLFMTLTCCLCLMLSILSFQAGQGERYYRQAVQTVDPSVKVELFQQSLAWNPRSPRTAVVLSRLLTREKGVRVLQQSLLYSPKNASLSWEMAGQWMYSDDPGAALYWIRRSIWLDKYNNAKWVKGIEGMLMMGRKKLAEGNRVEAINCFASGNELLRQYRVLAEYEAGKGEQHNDRKFQMTEQADDLSRRLRGLASRF
jgi:hypothetical protein